MRSNTGQLSFGSLTPANPFEMCYNPPGPGGTTDNSSFSSSRTQVFTHGCGDARKLQQIPQRLTARGGEDRVERYSLIIVLLVTPLSLGCVFFSFPPPLIPFTQLPKDLLYEISAVRFQPITGQIGEYVSGQPMRALGSSVWACPQVSRD